MDPVRACLDGRLLSGKEGLYRCAFELRRGGMGAVLLAYRDGAGEEEPLVVKISLRSDSQAKKRMEQEVAALKDLHHPGIIPVLDDGWIDAYRWYVMPYVGSCNLGDILSVRSAISPNDFPGLIAGIEEGSLFPVPIHERVGLPLTSTIALLARVSETVAHAHERGVVHRDLKPANILLDFSGEPLLCDFGVARAENRELQLTAVDEVVGTVEYIAPELFTKGAPSPASDCYALGAMLYECLSGHPPPRRFHQSQLLPKPPQAPRDVVTIISHALHPDPAKRISSAAALAAELRRFQHGLPICSPSPSIVQRFLWPVYRRPLLNALLVTCLLMLLLAGLLWRRHYWQQQFTWQPPLIAWHEAELQVECFPMRDALWHSRSNGISALFPERAIQEGEHRHVIAATPIPPRLGQRIEISVDTRDASQEVGIFLASDLQRWDSGYILQLGAYENSGIILRRGAQVLWMAEQRMIPQHRINLALERQGDQLRVLLNNDELALIHDSLPLSGRLAGISTYVHANRTYKDPPLYRSFVVTTLDIPRLVNADWQLTAYGLVAEGARATSRDRIARQGIVHADALAMRLPSDRNDRLASLYLRQQGLRRLLPASENTPDSLEAYRSQLQDRADFHLLTAIRMAASQADLRSSLDQAYAVLPARQGQRLALAMEQHMPAREWIPVLDDMLRLSQGNSLQQDYLIGRRIGIFPDHPSQYQDYWQAVKTLANKDGSNYWQRQVENRWQRYQAWQELRAGQRSLSSLWTDPDHEALFAVWEEQLNWGSWPEHSYPEALTQIPLYIGHMLSQPIIPDRLQPQNPAFQTFYQGANWWQGEAFYALLAQRELSMLDWSWLLRHQAVLVLLSQDMLQSLEATPFLLSHAHDAILELWLSGLISGAMTAPDLSPASPPVLHFVAALQDSPENLPEPPVSGASLAPLLQLALAQAHQQGGNTVQASLLLKELAEGPEHFPVTQAAQAIIRWGWP